MTKFIIRIFFFLTVTLITIAFLRALIVGA